MARNVKGVVVGDQKVGKTCLVIAYTTNAFPSEYIPSVVDATDVRVTLDGQLISLALNDTSGNSDLDKLRPLCYPNTDVFLVCFSIADPTSFDSIKSRWLPELEYVAPIRCWINHKHV